MKKKSKITYKEAVSKENERLRRIAEDGMFGTQDEAKDAIFLFFKELKNIKLPDSKERIADPAIDAWDSWAVDWYSAFARYMGEFRKSYFEGNYVDSAYALENMTRHSRFYLTDGCRAALLEAGKLVLKDDFP
jgi:hypothetical protein